MPFLSLLQWNRNLFNPSLGGDLIPLWPACVTPLLWRLMIHWLVYNAVTPLSPPWESHWALIAGWHHRPLRSQCHYVCRLSITVSKASPRAGIPLDSWEPSIPKARILNSISTSVHDVTLFPCPGPKQTEPHTPQNALTLPLNQYYLCTTLSNNILLLNPQPFFHSNIKHIISIFNRTLKYNHHCKYT